VISGWTGYWYSALDRGDDNFQTAADRKAHGGMPLIPWFLDQVHKSDQKTGQRTLDVLDIHYYPQAPGLSVGQVGLADSTDAALRVRSTRSLWDPNYKDESWIADSDSYNDPPNVELIPRMKGWINQYYPGTKLGITEWRWYAEGTMNGALAIGDVLGTYGREGVDLACYWDDIYNAPLKPEMPGLEAFKMYRNFDGHDSTFGDMSVAATTATDPDKLSVYASEDTKTNQVKIMVLNKTRQEQMNTQVALQGGNFQGSAKVYQMSDNTNLKSSLSIQAMPDVPISGASLGVSLPPYSITLLVIDKSK
jgi:Glycoside hydrolase family 44